VILGACAHRDQQEQCACKSGNPHKRNALCTAYFAPVRRRDAGEGRPASALASLRLSFISDFPFVTGPARRPVLRDFAGFEGFARSESRALIWIGNLSYTGTLAVAPFAGGALVH
jgi:hypothetical protein